jgi:hypothetical protein
LYCIEFVFLLFNNGLVKINFPSRFSLAGQPALLYLVPCTLGPTAAMANVRGHWGEMWEGVQGKKSDRHTDEKGHQDEHRVSFIV